MSPRLGGFAGTPTTLFLFRATSNHFLGNLELNMSSPFRFQDIFVRGVQDPYPFYHWLRTEAPVYWNAEVVPAWFISRYDDVVAIIKDDRRFGSRGGIESAVQQEQDGCFWHTQ